MREGFKVFSEKPNNLDRFIFVENLVSLNYVCNFPRNNYSKGDNIYGNLLNTIGAWKIKKIHKPLN